MNKWLTPLVKDFRHYFGKTLHPVVWEVGSRDGNDGFELAHRIYAGNTDSFWKDATIVALEPNPDQVRVIKENYPEMRVLEVAASNKAGEAPFMVYHGRKGTIGSSSLNLNWKRGVKGHQITVKTDWLENLIGDEIIDVMKIDVESYSLQVLRGLGKKLEQVRMLHVETEAWIDTEKIEKFMERRHFKLCDAREQYRDMPDQVWLNRLLI